MNLREIIIPIKYKFLAVLLTITLSALAVFFYFTNQIFSDDKKLFVMDLNLTLLRAATSEIKLELRSRLEELQILIPRVYRPVNEDGKKQNLYEGLSENLPEEVLRIAFYRRNEGKIENIRDYKNTELYARKKLTADAVSEIESKHPLKLEGFFAKPGLELINRSVKVAKGTASPDLAVLTFVLPGSFVDSESKELMIVVDIIQDFLRKKLHQSDVAQLFLISKKGILLSHGLLNQTVDFSSVVYPHPVVNRLKDRQFPRESFEVDIDREPYLCNLSETGFNDVFAVSQIKKSEAFAALRMLMEKSILIAGLILCIAVIISVLFAASLTSNIQKLRIAAEQIGTGNLKTQIDIRSNDEIQSVSKSFQWMVNRLQELVAETAQKARMEDELATARLVQSTLLATAEMTSDKVQISAHYLPASECGGDVWDSHLDGQMLTVFIADATGHGAPAAIVTAVAKSCFNTLNNIYAGQPLTPEQFLTTLNLIIHEACKGQLLMTMCIVQINLETGEMVLGNAGHESPMCLRAKQINAAEKLTDKKPKQTAEVLFARGERLGFDPSAEFVAVKYQLNKGDTLLLYTDGISEAHNTEGKEWGERSLKKTFAGNGPRDIDQIKSQIVERVNEHTQGAEQKDDITFVLVKMIDENAASKPVPKRNEIAWDNALPETSDTSMALIEVPGRVSVEPEKELPVETPFVAEEKTPVSIDELLVKPIEELPPFPEVPEVIAETPVESVSEIAPVDWAKTESSPVAEVKPEAVEMQPPEANATIAKEISELETTELPRSVVEASEEFDPDFRDEVTRAGIAASEPTAQTPDGQAGQEPKLFSEPTVTKTETTETSAKQEDAPVNRENDKSGSKAA